MSQTGEFRRIRCADLINVLGKAGSMAINMTTTRPSTLASPVVLATRLPSIQRELVSILQQREKGGTAEAIREEVSQLLENAFSIPPSEANETASRLILDPTTALVQVQTEFKTLTSKYESRFLDNLVAIVQQATQQVGFPDVEVRSRTSEGIVRVVGIASGGEEMVAEIVEEVGTKELSILTETFGFPENSCSVAHRIFQDELARYGVITQNQQHHYKGDKQTRIPEKPAQNKSLPKKRRSQDRHRN